MYCVVYEFKIIPGENSRFEKAWAEYTEALYRVKGSLGSRLHKTESNDVYVAYAQWPSRETFESKTPDDLMTTDEINARQIMIETLIKSETKYKLDVLKDHIRTFASGGK